MPLYVYRDVNTQKEVEVIRYVSQMDELPLAEECTDFTEEEYNNANWERIQKGANIKGFGAIGKGGKGAW